MKIFFLALIFVIFCYQCESVEVECKYSSYGSYSCDVKNWNLITSKDNRDISSVRGQHFDGKSESDVKEFWSYSNVVKFFPRGLTKFFKNIENVKINGAGLEEVSKEDLKQFGESLKTLDLSSNEIEKIDVDLFEFNPNLERIDMRNNRIKHIGDGAFSGLEKLKTLWINSNPCTSAYNQAFNNRQEVLEVILKVEASCKDLSLTTIEPEIARAD